MKNIRDDFFKNLSLKKVFVICLFEVVIAAGFLFLNNNFPKVCDDMTFSFLTQSDLTAVFKHALTQGNGRLFGNFLGFLVGFQTFTAVEKTVVWLGIINLFLFLIGSKNILFNTLASVILIYPCDSIFSQVYAWNAGFQNYAFPVFIILFDILLIKAFCKINKKSFKALIVIALFVSAFCGQFFSENSSLFALCLSVFVIGASALNKNKSGILSGVLYFISASSGFALMMTYPHILGTSQKISEYRSYPASVFSLFSTAAKNYRAIANDFSEYFILWIVLSAAFIFLINKVLTVFYNNKKWKSLFFAFKLILIVYPAFSFFYGIIMKQTITFPRYYLKDIQCALLFIYAVTLVFISVLLLIRKSIDFKYKLSALGVLLACCSTAPLLAVSPIGARTFYIPFMCLWGTGLFTLKPYFEDKINPKGFLTCFVCFAGICSLLTVLGVAVEDNKYCENVRTAYLRTNIQQGETSITLPLLPHENIVHEDANKSAWSFYIKNTYDKTDIELSFIDWNTWYLDYYR